jgi:DNA-directed RNA polymerase specialized sigma24 family protein
MVSSMGSNDTMRRERFLRLWHAHYGHVLAYGLRRAPEGAGDLAAEVFTIAWRRIDDVPSHDPLPWLYACARRVLLNERRGRRRRAAEVLGCSRAAYKVRLHRARARLREQLGGDRRARATACPQGDA